MKVYKNPTLRKQLYEMIKVSYPEIDDHKLEYAVAPGQKDRTKSIIEQFLRLYEARLGLYIEKWLREK